MSDQLQKNAENIAKQLDHIESQLNDLELKSSKNNDNSQNKQQQQTQTTQTTTIQSSSPIAQPKHHIVPASGSLDSMQYLHPQVVERKASNICVFGAGSFGTSKF